MSKQDDIDSTQAKNKLPNKTSFKPGQSGNPNGRPKVYKSIEELREVIQKECSKYIVSGKMFKDLESMTELKRFNGMMELLNAWVLQVDKQANNQLPAGDIKVQMVFESAKKEEVIELKQSEGDKYE